MLRSSFSYVTGFSPTQRIILLLILMIGPLWSLRDLGHTEWWFQGTIALSIFLLIVNINMALTPQKTLQISIDEQGMVALVSEKESFSHHWRVCHTSRVSPWVIWLSLISNSTNVIKERKVLALAAYKLDDNARRILGFCIVRSQYER
ncbi:protein YgfX [Alteromonas facilis]|uniref:protein YgfX n=1 Tax=Alteromonas facilis TaxID=2048004 RepID=UPI000F5D2A8F|nr:hypothetical protein [Alteromonas facilis]